MVEKDYLKWHVLKSGIESGHNSPLFREREVWWCSLGANVGVEEDGKNRLFERPVLVFRKFNSEMFWGLPMTSKTREGIFHISFFWHQRNSTVIISQIRILSAKRLVRRFGKLSVSQFRLVNQSFESFVNKTDPFRGPRVPRWQ